MKKAAALAAAAMIAATSLPANQAHAWDRGGAIAAGVIGGVAAGALIGAAASNSYGYYGGPYAYGPAYAYAPAYAYEPAYYGYAPRYAYAPVKRTRVVRRAAYAYPPAYTTRRVVRTYVRPSAYYGGPYYGYRWGGPAVSVSYGYGPVYYGGW